MSEKRTDYALSEKEKLVQYVKEAGQELINKADDIVGNPTLMSDLDISINIPCHDDRAPEITVTKITSPETTYERWMKEM